MLLCHQCYRLMVRLNSRCVTTAAAAITKQRRLQKRRPALDFDCLLNPDNLNGIIENCQRRNEKTGDIEKTQQLWRTISSHLDGSAKVDDLVELETLWDDLYKNAAALPNRTYSDAPTDVPFREIRRCGDKPVFDGFKPKSAESKLKAYHSLRTDDVTHSSGERAYALLAPLAQLETRVINYALSMVMHAGFRLVQVPDIVETAVTEECGVRQRSARGILYDIDDTTAATDASSALCLSGTAEMGIAALLRDRLLEYSALPLKLAAVSRCYRPEVAEGRKGSGLYRVHEFTKVEMFGVTANSITDSQAMMKEIVGIQQRIFESFRIHFRVLEMGCEELGAPAYRKIDCEAWMPGRDMFGEISSASDCTDYQSVRLNLRYKKDNDCFYPHTVNGTAVASPRIMIPLLETHQTKTGIELPSFLQTTERLQPLKSMKFHAKMSEEDFNPESI